MLGAADVMAFVVTTDAAAARAFYEKTLGLRFVADDEYALVFDCNGTMLRIQKVREHAPRTYTALGWKVSDIAASVASLVRVGVHFEHYGFETQDRDGIWTTTDGTKVAWFKDPSGNLLSLTQFPG